MGFECIDENLLGLIQELSRFFMKYYSIFITAGQALGAVFVIFIVGGQAYQVMLKGKAFDVLAILRPIAFAIILANWIPFVTAIAAVPRMMESYAEGIFNKEHASIIDQRQLRTEAAEKVAKRTREAKAAADMAQKQISDGNVFDRLSNLGEDMMEMIKEQLASFATVIQAQANQWLEEWVMKIGEIIWQISFYLLFFIKECFVGILVITGPITFALSILPIWKDAWVQWIARYVSVLLYGFIGFFVLAAALQLIKYGIKIDIQVLTTAASSAEAFAAYTSSSIVTALFHFTTLLVGAVALRMVPELATWIIPATAGHAAKEFTSGVSSGLKSGASTVVKGATN